MGMPDLISAPAMAREAGIDSVISTVRYSAALCSVLLRVAIWITNFDSILQALIAYLLFSPSRYPSLFLFSWFRPHTLFPPLLMPSLSLTHTHTLHLFLISHTHIFFPYLSHSRTICLLTLHYLHYLLFRRILRTSDLLTGT